MVITIAASTLALSLGVNPASATDPRPPPPDLVGVGSDTTQDVMTKVGPTLSTSGYGPNYNLNISSYGHSQLFGWDAVGSPTIVPRAGCAAIVRPNGSNAGISALLADEATGLECLDYARSSRAFDPTKDGDLQFIPYAKDDVTWATYPLVVGGTTYNAPPNLTTAQLNSIYSCTVTNWSEVGEGNAVIKPYLPQSGSGTRSFFLSAIGVTTPGPCVIQPTTFQQNDGTQVPVADRPNAILPYSVAKYIAQTNGVSTDNRAGAILRNINGTKPVTAAGTLNTSFSPAFVRTVFNVLKPADLSNPDFHQVFGRSGYICSNPDTARTFGFAPLPRSQCGYI